jgi:hypothetical protein
MVSAPELEPEESKLQTETGASSDVKGTCHTFNPALLNRCAALCCPELPSRSQPD